MLKQMAQRTVAIGQSLRGLFLILSVDVRRYVVPDYKAPIRIGVMRNTFLLLKHLVVKIYQVSADVAGFFVHDFSRAKVQDRLSGLRAPIQQSSASPTTIVIIGGIHGAIFNNAIWSRFSQYCNNTLKVRCLLIAPNGRGGCAENAEFEILPALTAEIDRQAKLGQRAKFAILGYSKGGLDTLHLLKAYPDFARQYISALVTVACPLRGAKSARKFFVPFAEWLAEPMSSDSRKDVKECKAVADIDPGRWTDDAFWRTFKAPVDVRLASLSFISRFWSTHVFLMLSYIFADGPTDGAVELSESRFPSHVNAIDLGVVSANHLVGLPGNETQDDRPIGEALVTWLCQAGVIHLQENIAEPVRSA
jgi:pimeloyl-ACP methyl ester carboxylesterase